jgi:hypothetical protein
MPYPGFWALGVSEILHACMCEQTVSRISFVVAQSAGGFANIKHPFRESSLDGCKR